jgi:hypothetical protein
VTDEAGCSMMQVFTGQTVSCNGSSQAQISQHVTVPPGVRLDVTRTGSGSGTVTSAPSGMQCGEMCSYAFGEDETVKLMESPEPGSTFAGWSGACSGEEATCEVTMSEAREVKAAFNALPPSPPPTGTPLSPIPQQALPLLKPHEASPPPSVQNARQSATRWREGNQLARITREKTPIGPTFSFSLNEQATVSFSFTQILHRDRRCLHMPTRCSAKAAETPSRGGRSPSPATAV